MGGWGLLAFVVYVVVKFSESMKENFIFILYNNVPFNKYILKKCKNKKKTCFPTLCRMSKADR